MRIVSLLQQPAVAVEGFRVRRSDPETQHPTVLPAQVLFFVKLRCIH